MSLNIRKPVCEYCHKELGEPTFKTFSLAYKEFNSQRKRSLFCNEGCFKEHIKQFQVEEYNGKPIYMVEVDGQKRYMPYWSSPYYFTTVEDCKKRMGSSAIGSYAEFIVTKEFK